MPAYPIDPVSLGTIDGLTWIRGAWIEANADRRCEEIWSGASANTMMGMFRWISENEVSFFEFMAIRLEDSEVELHAKHFHPTLVAWEERHRYQGFVLSELTENRAVFAARPADEEANAGSEGGWLIYERPGDGRLLVRLIQPTGEEKYVLRYVRAG
ncbi:hypothetical protein KJ567_07375 [Candidatus Bipolaricaulota bacterium]|nr:hypothetical protein [Candidatus Bipolaricaulota bacterium]